MSGPKGGRFYDRGVECFEDWEERFGRPLPPIETPLLNRMAGIDAPPRRAHLLDIIRRVTSRQIARFFSTNNGADRRSAASFGTGRVNMGGRA